MEKSIINRSNTKNLGRRQKLLGAFKLEKKNIESFRGHDQQIKEEAVNLSDEEQDFVGTPNDGKDRIFGIGDNRNPTYARVTHASKNMEFLGPMKTMTTNMFKA